MKIAIAASEAYPFSKTGGLADVAGALWKTFGAKGHDSLLVTPLYKQTKDHLRKSLPPVCATITVPLGSDKIKCDLRISEQDSCRVLFIDNSGLFLRDEIYGTGSADYPDNDTRFALFCRAALKGLSALEFRPDVIHCNDWQTGLIPLQLRTIFNRDPMLKNSSSVFTIHNLGYQGIFPQASFKKTGLPDNLFNPEGVEFYGSVNFLKAGIISADAVTTVSRTYAEEILSPDKGFGLDGVLKNRIKDFYGIPNGIDYDLWDPNRDPLLPSNYSADYPDGKSVCKRELVKKSGFKIKSTEPIFSFVGRLASQKGINLIIGAADSIVKMGCIAVVGKGNPKSESDLAGLQKKYPQRFRFTPGFDESAAHLAYAGSDIFIMPSYYEPCGLGQMIAMRYGTVPVARNTGGLSDTIVSAEHLISDETNPYAEDPRPTGFLFNDFSASALTEALFTASLAFNIPDIWNKLAANCMQKDFSWSKSANIYLELYRRYTKNLQG